MYRTLYCLGTRHPHETLQAPAYFFAIFYRKTGEGGTKSLSSTDIMRLAEGCILGLTSTAENESFSAFVDKLIPMISHQYGEDETIRLLQSFMESAAKSTDGPTFNPAAFLRQHSDDQVFHQIYMAISLYNTGSTAKLMGNLASGAFALSRQEALPAWDNPKELVTQASPPPAPEIQAAA